MCYSSKVRCAKALSEELRKVNKEFAHAKSEEERRKIGIKLNLLQAEYDGTPERVKMLREDVVATDNKHERSRKLGYISVCEQGYRYRVTQAIAELAKVNQQALNNLSKNKPMLPESFHPLQATFLEGKDLVYEANPSKQSILSS